MNRNKLNFYLDVVSALAVFALVFTGFLLFFVLPPGTGGRHGGEASILWSWTRHDFGDIHFYLACTFVALAIVHIWLHWTWVCSTFACFFGNSKPTEQRRRAYGIGIGGSLALVMVGGLFCASSEVQTTSGERRGGYDAGVGQAQLGGSRTVTPTPSESSEGPFLATRERPDEAGQLQRRLLDADSGQREDNRRGRQTRNPRSPPAKSGHDREEPHVRGNNAITGQTTLAEAARLAGINVQSLRQELGLPVHVDIHERLGRLKRSYGFDIFAVRNIIERHTKKSEQ